MKEFAEIYEEYYRPLYVFLLRLTSDNFQIAEELTQEAFYQAFISFHRYNGKCKFFTWLCQIAKNSYFKYLRKNREVFMDFSRLEEAFGEDEEGRTELICENKMMSEDLRKAIETLNKKQRDVIILRVYFERSFKEIGNSLGLTENTVKVNYHRGKEKLKERFRP